MEQLECYLKHILSKCMNCELDFQHLFRFLVEFCIFEFTSTVFAGTTLLYSEEQVDLNKIKPTKQTPQTPKPFITRITSLTNPRITKNKLDNRNNNQMYKNSFSQSNILD